MRVIKIKRLKGELNLPLVYLMVSLLVFFFAYFLYILNRISEIPCVFKNTTGYPCPTCGTTRLIKSLLSGEIYTAFHWNPMVFIGLMIFLLWTQYGFYMLFSGTKFQFIFSKKEGYIFRTLLIFLFILNWIYLIITDV